MTSLAAGLFNQPEEHSGAQLADRLETVENSLTSLTSDGDGRLSNLERSLEDLTQTSQQSQDSDTKYRRLRRQVRLTSRKYNVLGYKMYLDKLSVQPVEAQT